jgi:hypothetical protein
MATALVVRWSCPQSRRGEVSLVQVNGNNRRGTPDRHSPLKNNLLPPTDKAVSALLDDLSAMGLLGETLIVMAGSSNAEGHQTGGNRLPGRPLGPGADGVLPAVAKRHSCRSSTRSVAIRT